MKVYTTESLSSKRHFTPEGYLVCEDVPLARIGEQIYGPDETPIQAGPDGLVRVLREPEEVFRPATIASAHGKPVVRDHPDAMEVTSQTWRDLAKGVILNPRRGSGADADVMIADLLITDQDEIERIVAEMDQGIRPELSMGYDCDYDAIGDDGSGLGRQKNIVLNHGALVDQGRCGPRCAIGDNKGKGDKRMAATTDKKGLVAMLRRAFKSGDEKKIEAALDDCEAKMGDGDDPDDGKKAAIEQHFHLKGENDDDENPQLKKRVDSIEKEMRDGFKKIGDSITDMKKAIDKAKDDDEPDDEEEKKEKKEKEAEDKKLGDELEEEAPDGTGDKARKAKDSAYLEESYQRTVADAEILAPGLSIPAFDRNASPRATFDGICSTRRRALDIAMTQADVKTYLANVTRGRGLDTKSASCRATRDAFNSVVAMMRQRNNSDNTRDAHRANPNGHGVTKAGDAPQTIADLNRINADRRAKRQAALTAR